MDKKLKASSNGEDCNCYIIGDSIINFDDYIEFKPISTLMDCIEVQKEKQLGHVNIYFSSSGGAIGDLDILIDYLKNNTVGTQLNFKFKQIAFSCGLFLIFRLLELTNVTIEVSDNCMLMAHTALLENRLREPSFEKMNHDIDRCFISEWKYKFEKAKIPEDKIQAFCNGRDVYMTGKEFNVYLDNYIDELNKETQVQNLKFYREQVEILEEALHKK